jgi:hypothetical protein
MGFLLGSQPCKQWLEGRILNIKDLELWKGSRVGELKRQNVIELSFRKLSNAICIVRLRREEFKCEILQFKELEQIASGYNFLTIPIYYSFIF